jgi:hypothetical protein
MRTQAHRIVDTDPKRGNVVVRVTGTRHDEPTYQVRQSLPNTQEVPGHDHHTNRVRETGSGSHGPILRSVPTNRLSQHLDRSSGSRHPGHAEHLHPAARASPKAASGVPRVSDKRLPYAANVPLYD